LSPRFQLIDKQALARQKWLGRKGSEWFFTSNRKLSINVQKTRAGGFIFALIFCNFLIKQKVKKKNKPIFVIIRDIIKRIVLNN